MNKLYFSDIKHETWEVADSISYVIVPKKWWSIKQWLFAMKFSKEVQLFFMKVK